MRRPISLRNMEFRRILIVKPSSLGDVVHALPVLNGLRQRYPSAEISWLVGKPFAPLIAGHPQLDETIIFDREHFSRFGRRWAATRDFWRFVQSLRARRFELAVDLQGLFRSGFLTAASGARYRLGFSDAREGARLFYRQHISIPPGTLHAVDKNYLVAGNLGFDDVPIRFDFALNGVERNAADAALRENDIDPATPFATLWPGARWETKRWPAERFSQLADLLHNEFNLFPVLMGDPGERELCERIAESAQTTCAVLAGKTNIRQAIAVIERAHVTITHDSAPMHFAAAFGRPLVAIVGPTNPERTGPYNRANCVVSAGLDCSPCYLKRASQCPYDLRCMADVGVEDIGRRVAEVIQPVPEGVVRQEN